MVEFDPALPGTRSVGDPNHTPDHNTIVAALNALNVALESAEDRITALEVTTPEPTIPGIYGAALAMDGLANTSCGGSGGDVSFRFRAEQSSTLVALRTYFMGGSGYGGGSGGTIRISVEADVAGFPSGTRLAEKSVTSFVAGSDAGRLTTFTTPATLTAGSLYHIVFTNTDASPTVNFTSINSAWTSDTLDPRQPRWPDADVATCLRYPADSWEVRGSMTPIMDLTYGNGVHQGQGYMEVEIGNQPTIEGTTKMMRERFTVSGGDRVVSGAFVRMAKVSGTGDLTVRLEDSGDTLIDSFTVAAASIPTLATNADGSGDWVSGSFATPRTLTNGATYNLRLSVPAGTVMWSRGIQQGAEYNYNPATYFADGQLEFTTNSGSSWGTVTGLEADGDMQFYFPVVA